MLLLIHLRVFLLPLAPLPCILLLRRLNSSRANDEMPVMGYWCCVKPNAVLRSALNLGCAFMASVCRSPYFLGRNLQTQVVSFYFKFMHLPRNHTAMDRFNISKGTAKYWRDNWGTRGNYVFSSLKALGVDAEMSSLTKTTRNESASW